MKLFETTIRVKSLDESLKFYTEIVGLNIVNRFEAGPGSEIAFLGDGETKIELLYMETSKDVSFGDGISLGFEVESLDEKITLIKEKGLTIYSGPYRVTPNSQFFTVLDPNGLIIKFIENK